MYTKKVLSKKEVPLKTSELAKGGKVQNTAAAVTEKNMEKPKTPPKAKPTMPKIKSIADLRAISKKKGI